MHGPMALDQTLDQFLLAQKFAHGFQIHGPLLRGISWFNRSKAAVSSGVGRDFGVEATNPPTTTAQKSSGQPHILRLVWSHSSERALCKAPK